jgi:hypothetical protein
MCHNNVITDKWVIRGLLYNFIGLFALQSGREYASIAAADNTDNGGGGGGDVFIFDSPSALALIRYSGVILMSAGFIYMFLGVACCKVRRYFLLFFFFSLCPSLPIFPLFA